METGSVAGYGQLEFSFRWEWWGGSVDRRRIKDFVSYISFFFFNWELSRHKQLCPQVCGSRVGGCWRTGREGGGARLGPVEARE